MEVGNRLLFSDSYFAFCRGYRDVRQGVWDGPHILRVARTHAITRPRRPRLRKVGAATQFPSVINSSHHRSICLVFQTQ